MPRIPDSLLDAVVYLYPTVEAAKAGKDAGGTGFIIQHPFENVPGFGAFCIVTCKHVAGSAPVPRLNRKDGGPPDCLPLDDVHWCYHRGPHDLAIYIGGVNEANHKFAHLLTSQLLTQEEALKLHIGVGDDVFMLGRFIGHEGRVHNEPTARFGHVSAPTRPMFNVGTGVDEESYAVEMHSKPGYSGSPTFVWSSVFNAHITPSPRSGDQNAFVKILGVNWGQIFEKRPLQDKDGKEIAGPHVREASGMNGVVPAWHIFSLMKQPEAIDMLKQIEAVASKRAQAKRSSVEPAAAVPASDENPTR